jgi:CHAD domain-containing protein
MAQFTTPITILQSQTEALIRELPRVFDGDVDGVHDARVATRRIREVLPLTHEWESRRLDDLADRFKRIGRALGRVRDADVRIGLLAYLESHIPSAAAALVPIRQQRERKRLRMVRKLIKEIERLDLRSMLHHVMRRGGGFQPWTTVFGSWRGELARTMAQRAHEALLAIDHATGTYFPNRAHMTRVALKKLRYAAEIGEQTGVGAFEGSIRELKKGQDLLGELHDREVLIEKLPDVDGERKAEGPLRTILQTLDAECRGLHRDYVERRDRLRTICTETERMFARRRPSATTVTAAAVAASSAAYAWRRLATQDVRREEVAIRIPIRERVWTGR